MKIYNGENIILGRLAAHVAKDALLGEEVRVVNCDKVMISGKKTNTLVHEKHRRDRRGYPLKSAKISRLPHLAVRRTIRGMLPWKNNRGREAYKRILCYIGVPEAFLQEKIIILEKADVKKLPNLKYVTIGEVCRFLRGEK